MKFEVPIYRDFKTKSKIETKLIGLNWYRNAHFQILNKVKKEYLWIVKSQYQGKLNVQKVSITYNIYFKRRGTDGGNCRSVIEKFVLDALVESGVIANDTLNCVISDESFYFIDKENPRCEIIITPQGGKPF
jgi:hypothetical protein